MTDRRSSLRWMGVLLGSMIILGGCAYAVMHKLSLDEKGKLRKLLYEPLCQPFQQQMGYT